MSPPINLSAMNSMPTVGLGMWKVGQPIAKQLVRDAAEAGYRHFDCACDYGNEAAVGDGFKQAIEDGICSRDDLWITSKLWNTYHAKKWVRPACERTLSDLGLDYLDLYLIHFPIALKFVPFENNYPPGWFHDPDADFPRMEFERTPYHETWTAMEQLVRDGLVKHIGVSNLTTGQLRDLLTYADIRPAALQVECHPYLTQDRLLRYCKSEAISFIGFSPLGAPSYVCLGMAEPGESVMQDPAVIEIAQRIGRSPAQVLLRWGVQRGGSVVPKSSRKERLIENLALFDFQLSAQDMTTITGLNRNRRFNDPGAFCEAAFNTFCPIYD